MTLGGFEIIFLCAALINLTSAAMLMGFAQVSPLRPTLFVYGGGLAMTGITLLAVAFREPLGLSGQDWFITNASVLVSAALLLIAVHTLFDLEPPWRSIGVVTAIGLIALAALEGPPELRPWRNLVTLGGMALSMFLRAFIALRHHRRDDRGPALAMALLLTLNGLAMSGSQLINLLRPDAAWVVGVAALFGVVVAVPVLVTFLMLVNRRSLAQLRYRADHDGLSGALTRRAFFERAGAWLQRAPLGTSSVVMFDFDHFKRINDEHGHQAGDAVIREGIGELRAALPRDALLARYGGEEFVVLLALPGEPELAVEALRRNLNAAASAAIDQPVTVSAGLSPLARDERVESAIARADRALYQAKEAGRDRLVVELQDAD